MTAALGDTRALLACQFEWPHSHGSCSACDCTPSELHAALMSSRNLVPIVGEQEAAARVCPGMLTWHSTASKSFIISENAELAVFAGKDDEEVSEEDGLGALLQLLGFADDVCVCVSVCVCVRAHNPKRSETQEAQCNNCCEALGRCGGRASAQSASEGCRHEGLRGRADRGVTL